MLSLKGALRIATASRNKITLIENETHLAGETILEKLDTLFQQRRLSSINDVIRSSTSNGKLAVCIVIVDNLHHEEIWRDWLGDEEYAKLYIHAKFPEKITSDWVKTRLIPQSFKPEWNSVEVIRCMNALLEYAIAQKTHDRYIFCTESCIPLYSSLETSKIIHEQEKGFVPARNTPKNHWEKVHCFDSVNQSIIPSKSITKAVPGWILLTANQAVEIVSLPRCLSYDLISAFGPSGTWTESSGGVFAPEEVYFPTLLCILGYIRDNEIMTTTEGVLRHPAVFASFAVAHSAHPEIFSNLNDKLLAEMRKSGAIFGRKFRHLKPSLKEWRDCVINRNPNKYESASSPSTSSPQLTTSQDDEKQSKRKLDSNNRNCYNESVKRLKI